MGESDEDDLCQEALDRFERQRAFQTLSTFIELYSNFIEQDNLVQALQQGLRRAVDRVLATTPNLHDQDRLYFTLSSNRLTNNFQG